ncbi:MAG: InlB B-repeat-containing protein [Lachnospiraceae bacterium]|nr:InlB B-repeat-containing protein [Lachnospiraceae bacterium]
MKRRIKHFTWLTALVTMFAMLTVITYAVSLDSKDDMSLVFTPETQLTVYVDGTWDSTRSDTYAFGDYVLLSAPEVSGKIFSHWEADGSIISYNNPLELTINANTTLYAIYANEAPEKKAVTGFTSITRTDDGTSISFQAIASGETAGIVYSTTTTSDDLKIGGTDVTQVVAEKMADSITTMPESILDGNNCWILQITPDNADTVYHARTYVTDSGTTTYGDIKDVKLSGLESGVSMIADLGDELAGLKNDMRTITFDANGGDGSTTTQAVLSGKQVTLNANTFTREDYTFTGWNTAADGAGVGYADKAGITPSTNMTLYAQWKFNKTDSKVITAPTARSLTYTGSAQALVTEGKAEGGTMQYALGKDATTPPTSGWSTSIPTATNTGTYYVWYMVKGDENHNDTEAKSIVSKILAPTPVAQQDKDELSINAGFKVIQKGSKITIKWGKVAGATGYEVYVAYCGKNFSKKPTKTTTTQKSVDVTRLNGKKINLKKNFKVYVVAVNKKGTKKTQLAKTIAGHIVGRKNTNYTNAKSITLITKTLSITVGKTSKIKAKTVLVDKKKKQLSNAHATEFRYASADKTIAKVDKKGKVTGIAKGKTKVYVYSRNGLAKAVSVTVK